ncbi:MAG: EAL domain-containing protein [Pseudomonadota bacterium]
METKNTRLREEILQRERSEKSARESQAKFENAFRNAPIGMALVQADGLVIQRNDMFDSLLDTHRRSDLQLLTLIRGDEAQEDVREELQQLVIGSQQSFSLDADCVSNSGRELSCALHFSAIREDADFLYAVLQLEDTTESSRLAAELAHQARHDTLTGLPNRRAFEQALEDLARPSAVIAYPLTIGLIDLDKFKAVNDSAGHAAGDALLQRVADTIRGCVRERDMVVRLGGDEFAVLLRRCDGETGSSIAEVVRARIEDLGFTWEGTAHQVGASIGVVTLTTPPESLEEALRHADAACFAAKDRGRNQVCVVNEDDAPDEGDGGGEVHWARRLKQAIKQDEFALFAQEVRDLSQGTGAPHLEVLLRMVDAKGGTEVLPGAFLPIAERYGLAPQIDRWVLDHLLDRLEAPAGTNPRTEQFWINLSTASLTDGEFIDHLQTRLASASLPVGAINFELRTSVLARDVRAARECIDRLQPLGCRFAIDDFGAGSDPLSQLRAIPVDLVKIDGNLIKQIANDRIAHIYAESIVRTARELRIKTCAKCVETPQLLEAAQGLGVDQVQGFAIDRPSALTLASAPALALAPASVPAPRAPVRWAGSPIVAGTPSSAARAARRRS